MACELTSGISSIDCRDNQGGIAYIYIASVVAQPATITETAGQVTGISYNGTPVSSSNFFKFAVNKQTSSFTETMTASSENGTVFFQQDVNVVFRKLESAKRDVIKLLASATDLLVVVKDNNGKFWSVGITRGAELSAGTGATGTAYGDLNGYNLTFTGYEIAPSYEVAAALVGE
jgi:hypothetical protein